MDKTKTVAWICAATAVVVVVILVVTLTTKQTVTLSDGKTGTISSTNLLKKS